MAGSVSACLAWGDMFVKNMFTLHNKQVLKRLSLLRHRGTPTMAHLPPPDSHPLAARQGPSGGMGGRGEGNITYFRLKLFELFVPPPRGKS